MRRIWAEWSADCQVGPGAASCLGYQSWQEVRSVHFCSSLDAGCAAGSKTNPGGWEGRGYISKFQYFYIFSFHMNEMYHLLPYSAVSNNRVDALIYSVAKLYDQLSY